MVADPAEREGELQSGDGTKLRWRAWEVESEAPILAVVHGHGEHSGRYARLARAMAEHGHSTYAFDLRGMGESAGRRGHVDRWGQWIEDLLAFVAMVQTQARSRELVPLGHSFGGVLLTSALLAGALEPGRFVLSNPAFRPRVKVPAWKLRTGRLTSGLLPRLTMATGLDPGQISRDPAEVEAYRGDPLVHDKMSSRLFTEWQAASEDCLARAGEVKRPYLLILGQDDRIIDHQASLEFAGRTPAPHVVKLYPGRYHEPFNDLESAEVFDDLADWLAGRPS